MKKFTTSPVTTTCGKWGTVCALLLATLSTLCAIDIPQNLLWESGSQKSLVIELFTSEGCSSCPPAEEYLGTFRAHPKLWDDYIPVSWHVSIWDEQGWKDPYALPEFSKRQEIYAETWKNKTLYTPSFVVGGTEWPGYYRRERLAAPPDEEPGNLRVLIQKEGTLRAAFTPVDAMDEPPLLTIVPLGFNLGSQVEAGENAGRHLEHQFVALNLIQKPLKKSSDYTWELELKIPPSQVDDAKPQALAIWVSRPQSPLVPWQAIGGWLAGPVPLSAEE